MRKSTIILVLLFAVISLCGEEPQERLFTLQDSVKIALENNLDIKTSEQKIVQKKWEKEDSKTSFLPKIVGTFSWTHLDKVPSISVPGMPIKIEMSKNDIYNARVTLSQPIFTGGALSSQYEMKKQELDIAHGENRLTTQDVIFQVIQAYFSILKASNFHQAATALVNQRQAHLVNVKKLFDAGLATKADILKTEVALADARQKLVETENMINLAKENFKTILNFPYSCEINIEDTLTRVWEGKELEAWKQIAIKNREEIKQIERSKTTLELAKKIVKSGYYPNIAFVLSLQGEKGTSSGLNSWYQNISALLTANFDIWNWQSTKKKINALDSQILQIETQKQKIINLINLEITSSYLNLISAQEKIKVMEKAVEDAQENVRINDLLRREGLATTTDVLDAQTYLFQTKASYYQALYDYQIAHYQLIKASGQLIDEFLATK